MSKKILCIEDSTTTQKIILHTLSQSGYFVDLANNGAEGLDELRKDNYDLVLLDLIMPKVNGFHVLRELHRDGEFAHIPVIVISSDKRKACIDEVLRLGAKKFLAKPFSQEDLQNAVSEVLKNRLGNAEMTVSQS